MLFERLVRPTPRGSNQQAAQLQEQIRLQEQIKQQEAASAAPSASSQEVTNVTPEPDELVRQRRAPP